MYMINNGMLHANTIRNTEGETWNMSNNNGPAKASTANTHK